MKKLFIAVLLITLLLILASCGAKQKMEEKITEKIVEKTLGANVDIDGEEVTFKGEDGEEVTFGSTEWPDSEAGKKIPEFKKGKVTSAVNSKGYVFVMLEEVDEDDFKAYYEDIKSKYTEDSYESKYEGVISYSGGNTEGIIVGLSYSTEDKSLTIQATMPEESE
ncbi:MAG TPA: hypothetical protein DC038_00210 [Clostridiales bacterium]|nr:hypothetical protein [Clostridiales bacterium]